MRCEKCIYCGNDSSLTTDKEHVFPESLGFKETLPLGYVCKKCNQYFSTDLDKSVLYNRLIAMHAGTNQVPGKKNKIRKKLGEKLSFPNYGEVSLVVGPTTIPAGTIEAGRKFEITLSQSKEFSELHFARGIHKIAFNSFAYRYGYNEANSARYDKVRKYVRSAVKSEIWPYAVKLSSNSSNECRATYNKCDLWEVVELQIWELQFLVSLMGWNQEIENNLNGDIIIVRKDGQWNESSLLGLRSC
jgi:hypothetical protein